jgi:hypothetical protein
MTAVQAVNYFGRERLGCEAATWVGQRHARHGIPLYYRCCGLRSSLALFIFFHNTLQKRYFGMLKLFKGNV